MKIIFSPFFDQATYRGNQTGAVLGEKTVGLKGLLSELLLRAGMTHMQSLYTDRLVDYYKALQKASSSGNPFYKASFEKDDFAVASELLRWRDALVMTGWNCKDTDPSNSIAYKFNDLAAVEPFLTLKGDADWWRELYPCLNYMEGDEIEVLVPRESLDTIVTETLGNSGARITYAAAPQASKLDIKADIKVMSFRNRVDAYRWAAGQTPKEGDIYVNADNKAFNDVLRAHDLPLQKADYTESNPQILQLFKLGYGLFRQKVDVQTVVSYLQAPYSPVKYELRRELLRHILKTGGYGDGWNEILAASEKKYPELERLSMEDSGETVGYEVIDYTSDLIGWIVEFSDMLRAKDGDSDVLQQLDALESMVLTLNQFLMETIGEKGSMPMEQLARWVDGIYSPADFSAQREQVGAFDVVADPKAVVGCPEKMIWLDCNAAPRRRYPLYFLSPAELGWLRGRGVSIVDDEDFARMSNVGLKLALSKVKRELILVTSQMAYGSRCDEHPILTEIKATGLKYSKIEPEMPDGTVLELKPLEDPQVEIDLGQGIEIPQRAHGESYSSIATLIQHPVDYVLDYVAGLREQDFGQVADIAIIKGNVAHAVIAHCADMLKADERLVLSDTQIAGIIDSYAREMGQMLYNDSMQYGSFCLKLTQSVKTILSHIRRYGLRVFGNEVPVETELPVTGGQTIGKFNARIDLLLEDADGNFVIIDLKWSESRRFYDKVATQMDLQLVLYAEALRAKYPGRKVLGSAYYVIPQYKFISRDSYFKAWEEKDPTTVQFVELDTADLADVYGECTRSYFFRKGQLSRGLLENGELQLLNSLNFEYLKAMEEGVDLYPLDGDWQEPGIKAEAYGRKNFILKGRAL